MPTLVPEEERLSSTLAPPKQNVIIFDRRRSVHEPRIKGIFPDFAETVWISEFSREDFDRGGIGRGISVSSLLDISPVLFVTELELVPPLSQPGSMSPISWTDGIRLLENIRRIPGFKLIPPALVITNSGALRRARHNFQKLGVRWAFSWKGLRYLSEQARLARIVGQLVRGY